MSTRIYVGNLPYTATSEQLTQLFTEYGEVSEATVVIDRDTGRSKGFGFVQMTSDAAAHTAIGALNGTTLDDRAMRVSEAQARAERADSGYPRRTSGYRDTRW
ncbi:MAG TPA: RNA-binding protein [Ktedonobacterales bacterium]|jgi:RNA recognition motif-containing protein